MRNPADDASLDRKFFALSEKVLGPQRAQRAAGIIRSIDSTNDLGVLVSAIVPQPA